MNQRIEIIGAPSTFGQKKLGVNLGPDAIRYAGLLSRLKNESSPDSCVKCYTMFLPFLLIKIDVFS